MLNSSEFWFPWHTGSALAIRTHVEFQRGLDPLAYWLGTSNTQIRFHPLWPFPPARKEHFLAYICNSSNPICSIRIGYHTNKEYQLSDLYRYDGLPYKINNPIHCVRWAWYNINNSLCVSTKSKLRTPRTHACGITANLRLLAGAGVPWEARGKLGCDLEVKVCKTVVLLLGTF